MNIHINQREFSLTDAATVTDALAAFGAKPPFAVALNGQFVARGEHGTKTLRAGDKLDVVSPVAGG
ncbi:sulfur carrier protein ThiS [Caballeronia sp. LP006]|jgi:sulfur carrier protein|uniref:sulfur carrier protein ThiS n=1 Tax=unclassified Caballeronia TaxID=2646786 RepID=UPI001FD51ADD|nr:MULTISPECIES: sulfur carrier protein ThiS [unclassified Caballeronia]MDR5829584.1 sulfur carrier protein ThiS [Caballeronia sp. LP006]